MMTKTKDPEKKRKKIEMIKGRIDKKDKIDRIDRKSRIDKKEIIKMLEIRLIRK